IANAMKATSTIFVLSPYTGVLHFPTPRQHFFGGGGAPCLIPALTHRERSDSVSIVALTAELAPGSSLGCWSPSHIVASLIRFESKIIIGQVSPIYLE
uniref:Uncharacterized protein n=1 Tax=Hippocampus comes TaxID=109280 RepID=A0A3Q3DNU6_HIPCM